LNIYTYIEPIHIHWTYTHTLNLYSYIEPIHIHWTYTHTLNLYSYIEPILIHWTYTHTLNIYTYIEPILIHWTYTHTLNLYTYIHKYGLLRTKLCDKRDDFNLPIWTFHSHLTTFQKHQHMEYISPFIRSSRPFVSYQNFLDRGLLLTRKILS
jgi:hypothetical protein